MENDLTCWLVAQAGSNDEKNGGWKSRWIVPLRRVGRVWTRAWL